MPQIKDDQLIAEAYSQLKKGIKVELKDKHTTSRKRAKKIAQDHLEEDPKYYDKLEKCGLK